MFQCSGTGLWRWSPQLAACIVSTRQGSGELPVGVVGYPEDATVARYPNHWPVPGDSQGHHPCLPRPHLGALAHRQQLARATRPSMPCPAPGTPTTKGTSTSSVVRAVVLLLRMDLDQTPLVFRQVVSKGRRERQRDESVESNGIENPTFSDVADDCIGTQGPAGSYFVGQVQG